MAARPHRQPLSPPVPILRRDPGLAASARDQTPTLVTRIPIDRGARRPSALGCSLPLLIILSLVGLVTLAASGWLLLYTYYQASNRILPGVTVGPVALGGMKPEEAVAALEQGWQLGGHITLTDGLKTQSLSPSDLGLHINAIQTTARAHAVGHGSSLLLENAQLASALTGAWDIPPVVALDETAARAGLEALAPAFIQPPVDAGLQVKNAQVVETPATMGYTIDLEAALAALRSDPSGVMQSGQLVLQLQPVAPRIASASAAVAEAQQLLAGPLVIQAYDPITNENLQWSVTPEIIAGWLAVAYADDGPHAVLNETIVAMYLDELNKSMAGQRFIDPAESAAPLAAALRQGQPYWATLHHPATSYTVQPGDTLLKLGWRLGMPYWMIAAENPSVDPEALVAGQTLTIPSKDRLLPLPVIPGKRIVINITRQRLAVYENSSLLGEHVISTGIDRSPTQPGIFQVQSHERNAYASVWDLYMPHFLGIYEAWPGFMNGIHGLPTLSNGQQLWASILGSPASYGCIILDLPTARWLYNWAEDGTVVEVQP